MRTVTKKATMFLNSTASVARKKRTTAGSFCSTVRRARILTRLKFRKEI